MNPLEQAFSIPEFITLYNSSPSVRYLVANEPYKLASFVQLLKDILPCL